MYGYSYSATACHAKVYNRLAVDQVPCFASHKPVDYSSTSSRAARRGRQCTPTGEEKRDSDALLQPRVSHTLWHETGSYGDVRFSISSHRLGYKVAKC